MNIDNLTIDEIRKLDAPGRREAELGIRRELATIRMDIYSSAAAAVGKVRKLKSGLARILTLKTEALRAVPKAAKPAPAPKVSTKAAAKPAAKVTTKTKASSPAKKTDTGKKKKA